MPTARYIQKGVVQFWLVPTIASATLVPTTAEVNAGTRLDAQLAEINGFSYSTALLDAPNMKDRLTPKEPGEDQVADSSLLFYKIKGGTDTIHAAQPKDTVAYIVVFYAGIAGATPAAADVCDVWPIRIGSRAHQYNAGNELAKYLVVYGVTAAPGEAKALT